MFFFKSCQLFSYVTQLASISSEAYGLLLIWLKYFSEILPGYHIVINKAMLAVEIINI